VTGGLFAVAAVLVAAGWVGYRRRLARARAEGLDESQIRQIERSGRVEVEEPLDLREAAEEEDQFWSETWDEPEPL
jgi:type II secretory pathway pseudopilin PulG